VTRSGALRLLTIGTVICLGGALVVFPASRGLLPLGAHRRLVDAGRYLVSRSLDGTASKMLEEEDRLPHVVAVGAGLVERLESLRHEFSTSQVTFEVRRGDAAYPLGDGRLGYDVFKDRFKIRGYWTPQDSLE